MLVKIDENLPSEVASLLREAGHDASTVEEQSLQGAMDDTLIEICRVEERALITLDLDFADMRHYPPEKYAGIVVLRPQTQSTTQVLELFRLFLPTLVHQSLPGHLWIVSQSGVRVRPIE